MSGLAITVGRIAQYIPILDRSRRANLSSRQSAHQAIRVLGVGHRRYTLPLSGGYFPGRGIHSAQSDVPVGQARLFAVIYVLRLARHEVGAHEVLYRPDAKLCAGVFSS